MAHAEFEHIASLLRVWQDGEGYGDPYWGVAIRWLNRHEVEITLQQQKLTAGIYRAVMSACARLGIKRLLVRTYPDGATGPEVIRWLDVKESAMSEVVVKESGSEIPAEVLAQLANKKLALVQARIELKADFDGDGPELPCFEWVNDVTYRNVPITALLMLQGNVAAMISKIVEDGKQLNVDGAAAKATA